jgi:hypothetical protein
MRTRHRQRSSATVAAATDKPRPRVRSAGMHNAVQVMQHERYIRPRNCELDKPSGVWQCITTNPADSRGRPGERCGMGRVRYCVVVSYQPISLAELARFIAAEPDFDTRWRLVVEFLKEYHQEPAGARQRLLADAPGPTGDECWDVLLAGLAEHLAMRDGKDARGGRHPSGCGDSGSRSTRQARAHRRSCMPRPRSAGGACSSPTTRSTPRERSLATARPRGHRGGLGLLLKDIFSDQDG